MKNYLFYSTLSFTLVFCLIELFMSRQAGFSTFAEFNWLVDVELMSVKHMVVWLVQGFVLSFANYVYINSKHSLVGGLRFGLITGLLFTLLVLFNMMFQVDHLLYPFFADSLLALCAIYVLGFVLCGGLFGLLVVVFDTEYPGIHQLWSLA